MNLFKCYYYISCFITFVVSSCTLQQKFKSVLFSLPIYRLADGYAKRPKKLIIQESKRLPYTNLIYLI